MGYSNNSDRDDDEDWEEQESWEELHTRIKMLESHVLKISAYAHISAQCLSDMRALIRWAVYAAALPFGWWIASTLDRIISGFIGLMS